MTCLLLDTVQKNGFSTTISATSIKPGPPIPHFFLPTNLIAHFARQYIYIYIFHRLGIFPFNDDEIMLNQPFQFEAQLSVANPIQSRFLPATFNFQKGTQLIFDTQHLKSSVSMMRSDSTPMLMIMIYILYIYIIYI
jgi:hypothetical protein